MVTNRLHWSTYLHKIQIRNRSELEVNLAYSASNFLCFSFNILLVINDPKTCVDLGATNKL